jgi:hypothetical protein
VVLSFLSALINSGYHVVDARAAIKSHPGDVKLAYC